MLHHRPFLEMFHFQILYIHFQKLMDSNYKFFLIFQNLLHLFLISLVIKVFIVCVDQFILSDNELIICSEVKGFVFHISFIISHSDSDILGKIFIKKLLSFFKSTIVITISVYNCRLNMSI